VDRVARGQVVPDCGDVPYQLALGQVVSDCGDLLPVGTGAGCPLPVIMPWTTPHSCVTTEWYHKPQSGRRTKWTQCHSIQQRHAGRRMVLNLHTPRSARIFSEHGNVRKVRRLTASDLGAGMSQDVICEMTAHCGDCRFGARDQRSQLRLLVTTTTTATASLHII
jgi:hypothetical protein